MNWSEFFAMGGYAFYVWGSYAIAAVVLIINFIAPIRQNKALRRQLRDFYRSR